MLRGAGWRAAQRGADGAGGHGSWFAGGLAGEFEQVGPLVVVEVQGAGELVQDGAGGLDPALFEPPVVVGADRGELGDFFPAQAGDPSGEGVGGEPDGLWGQLGAPGSQELSERLQPVVVAAHGPRACIEVVSGRLSWS